MKRLFIIISLFLLQDSFGQNIYYAEILNDNAYDYSISHKFMNFIEENEPDSLFKFFNPSAKIDTLLLKRECAYTAKNFSSKNCTYKNLKSRYNLVGHFNARQFFQDTAGFQRQLFTITILLKYDKSGIYIDSINFACGNSWVHRISDLIDKKRLLDEPLPELPPPPPSDSLIRVLKQH